MYNILVVPSDNIGGVGFYRSTQPHIQLVKQYPNEFNVNFDMNPDWKNYNELKKYNMIHVHKGLFPNMQDFWSALQFCKNNNIVTVMDIDDYWLVSQHHPYYLQYKRNKIHIPIIENIKRFDYITTTTPIFAEKIKKYNKNVFVIPNAIDPTDDRFKISKKKSDKIRIGMIMGSTHEYDMKLMNDMTAKLPQDIIDKVQFVLCGFDLRGSIKMIDEKGNEHTRDLKPEETVWYRYEKMLTNNYKIVSPDYEKFLKMFVPDSTYPNVDNEHYKRCWTKDMNHYYQHYNECDILLVPLEENDFNSVKSQLKAIECCFSNTAIIASDFGPYQIDLISMFGKGGEVNEDGNAILINERKNHKDWAKYVTKLVNNPEYIKKLQNNLNKSLKDKYNLYDVTVNRAEIYRSIL